MALTEKVSGMGADASRTDKNLSARVSKIQREAKIQNSTGGDYTNRADLTSIAQGASTNVPTANIPQGTPTALRRSVPAGAFDPGSANEGVPFPDGAQYGGGKGTETQPASATAPNPDSIFVRAMAAANPESRQLHMMVEAYNEMEAI